MTKKNKFIGLFAVIGLLAFMLVAGVGLAVIVSRNLPYTFTDEQLTSDYLLSKSDYGDYVLVEGYSQENPADMSDGNAGAYLGREVEFSGDVTEVSLVQVGQDSLIYDQIKAQMTTGECDGGVVSESDSGDVKYLLSECEITVLDGSTSPINSYLYSKDGNWIWFVTFEGKQTLDEVIEAYKVAPELEEEESLQSTDEAENTAETEETEETEAAE